MDKLSGTTTHFLAAIIAGSAVLADNVAHARDVAPEYRIGSFGVQSSFEQSSFTQPANGNSAVDDVHFSAEQRSEMLFKLTPVPDAGDDMIDELDSSGGFKGEISLNRIDFMQPGEARMQEVHHGFSYSASIDIDQQDSFQSESRLISSRQLGIHYGRLGSVNYSGVDLSVRQFDTPNEVDAEDDKEMWSLGVTTGRRFSMTGLDPSDPLWTVSLRGQFNFVEQADESLELGDQQWYVSPGLHWQGDDFTLSADVLMPFMQSGEYETETDYRIRANIKKRF